MDLLSSINWLVAIILGSLIAIPFSVAAKLPAQDFAERGEFLERVVGFRAHHELRIEEEMHAVL